jgi:conjugative relaxase-like TrwC/TraI family protein
MLNVTSIRGNNQYAAAHYFSAADDYYAKEHPGEWQGRGAEALGLEGPVDQAQLSRLLDGKLPNGDQIQASFGEDSKKRMGLDLTFSAPKSVSMQALVGGDKAVVLAHDKAVALALEQVEKLAEARRKIDGKTTRERTGNLVIGKFRHEMSRAKDPQLHTHAVVMNMTQRSDGKWRAIANEDIFKVQHEIDAIYKSELARGLQELGYSIRLADDKGNFELGHISREQIVAFSARSQMIEEALANQGKTRENASTLEKQVIALATRPRKDESDRAVVKQYWLSKSQDLGIRYSSKDLELTAGEKSLDELSLPASMTPAQAVVRYAINHLTERESVVTHTQLISTALRRAVGVATAEGVRAKVRELVKTGALIESEPAYKLSSKKHGPALSKAGWRHYLREHKGWSDRQGRLYVDQAIKKGSLVEAEKRYTTHAALKREKAILAIEKQGRGTVQPLVKSEALETRLAGSQANEGQKNAVRLIVGSENRFVGIQGDAGTGKTFTINQAVELLKTERSSETPMKTLALAPYGNQVKALKSEGLDAHTLASFLKTKDKPINQNTIVLLDEAGVVGSRQMERLMRVVEKAEARLVLIGDTKQTEAIEAGRPFAQLQTAGMVTARIQEIQRQKDQELKRAVELAANGQAANSLQHIKDVIEIPNALTRHQTLVSDYLKLSETDRSNTLIITGKNDSRREINDLIREGTGLKGQGREFDTLARVDLTQAQRRFAPSYEVEMVVQPERDYKQVGLVRGETYRVVDKLPGNILLIQDSNNAVFSVNPRKVTQLSIYRLEKQELTVGDQIRVNRNNPSLDLTNGDRMHVKGIHGGVVQLQAIDSGKTIELLTNKPLHLEHAYSSTVHSAQGLTSERSMICMETKSRTTSLNLYYVAISRPQYESKIYTDSRDQLPSAILRKFSKTAALDLRAKLGNSVEALKRGLEIGKKSGVELSRRN